MPQARIVHRYDCDEDTFWRDIFFDQAFNRRLFLEHLMFRRWDVVRFEETDDEIRRVIEIVPRTGEMPAALRKLAGDQLGFTEEGRFDRRARRHSFRIVPNRLADKILVSGEIYLQNATATSCERVVELSVEAKIFGVGGLVEKQILGDTRANYERSAEFTRAFLAAR